MSKPYSQPGEKGTDTNQASENELRDMLLILQERYANSLSDVFLTDTQVHVLAEDLLPFIRTEKLKLLAEVRERVQEVYTPVFRVDAVLISELNRLEAEL